MGYLDGISNWFWKNFPLSTFILIIPLIIGYIYYIRQKETTGVIKNRVEVFFKGGTKAFYPCKIEKDVIIFNVDENEYKEPILHHPRIENIGSTIYRTYLFAEGVGSVDVPPLTQTDRTNLLTALKREKILPEDYDSEETTDTDLINYARFYNFDIEQVLDKPIMRSFSVSMNFVEHLLNGLIKQIRSLEDFGTSNIARIAYIAIGLVIGFFMAYSFALKGII